MNGASFWRQLAAGANAALEHSVVDQCPRCVPRVSLVRGADRIEVDLVHNGHRWYELVARRCDRHRLSGDVLLRVLQVILRIGHVNHTILNIVILLDPFALVCVLRNERFDSRYVGRLETGPQVLNGSLPWRQDWGRD
jgi:hypothetical protein